MLQIVLRNKKGVTLVEVLIALVILLIVFMGLLQASILSIENNVVTILRDEGVRLASDTMTALRSSPFNDLNRNNSTSDGTADDDFNGSGNLPGDPTGDPAGDIFYISSSATATTQAQNNARNLGLNTSRTGNNIGANYLISVKVITLDTNNKRVTVVVSWDWKGSTTSHRIVSLLRFT